MILAKVPNKEAEMIRESTVMRCISFDLLRFVRDKKPTETELSNWLGEEVFRFNVLREAGLLVVENGIVQFSAKHITPDSKGVWRGNRPYHIDKGTFDVF